MSKLVLLDEDHGYFGVAHDGEPINAFTFVTSTITETGQRRTLNATISEESAAKLLGFLTTYLGEYT